MCMSCSGVWSGSHSLESVHNLRALGNPDTTLKNELERIGYLGETKASWEATPFAAHFELHIGMLNAKDRKISKLILILEQRRTRTHSGSFQSENWCC